MRDAPGVRVPHMGWNRLAKRGASSLLDGVTDGAQAYFVHGYAADVSADTIAICEHGKEFSAIVQNDLISGAQFHPERSGQVGLRMLDNFVGVA
jgi:glutamine amidotransferase